MKKVELVSGISKDLIPLTLPDLTNKAKDAQEQLIKEETGGEESQKKSMVNAGTRIKMGSITPEKLANLDTTAIGSQASSSANINPNVQSQRSIAIGEGDGKEV